MRVQDIMTTDNINWIEATDSINRAESLMRQFQIHHLVVLEHKKPVGLITEANIKLLLKLDSRLADNLTVAEVMQIHVPEVEPNLTVREATNLMRGQGIDALMVMEQKQLIGIVTTYDILSLIGQGVMHIPKAEERPHMGRENMAKRQGPFNPSLYF